MEKNDAFPWGKYLPRHSNHQFGGQPEQQLEPRLTGVRRSMLENIFDVIELP